jgi:hypothetical protein
MIWRMLGWRAGHGRCCTTNQGSRWS